MFIDGDERITDFEHFLCILSSILGETEQLEQLLDELLD